MNYFADIHSYPTMKSYGNSFQLKQNSKNTVSKGSIWYYDPRNDHIMENNSNNFQLRYYR